MHVQNATSRYAEAYRHDSCVSAGLHPNLGAHSPHSRLIRGGVWKKLRERAGITVDNKRLHQWIEHAGDHFLKEAVTRAALYMCQHGQKLTAENMGRALRVMGFTVFDEKWASKRAAPATPSAPGDGK